MRIIFVFLAVLLAAAPVAAQSDPAPKVHVSLIPERTGIAPGQTVIVAVQQIIRSGWHTYWLNPGGAGLPTTIAWTLPSGWKAGAIQWPYPVRVPVGPLMDYGYVGKAWLLVPVTASSTAKAGSAVTLKADVDYLVCREVCIPEDANVTLPLTVTAAPAPLDSNKAGEFAATRAKLPQASPWPARYSLSKNALDLFMQATALATARPISADFFPAQEGMIAGTAPQQLGFATNGLVLRLQPDAKLIAHPAPLLGVLVLKSADGSVKALQVDAARGVVPSAQFSSVQSAAGTSDSTGLLLALLLAFAGGLILNLMPCVLPVLAMKAFAIASTAGAHPREAAREGFAYGVGAVLSFLALGGAVMALRAGGAAVGWGFQLQQPIVVAGFALLIFAVGLYLSGVYELSAGLNAGEALTRRSGSVGAFFTGVLAVAVAAPCTAPFMAAALGYALTQSAVLAMLVFLALGLGFAAPFVAIGISPHVLRVLPRPGAWMMRLKQLLAFPMYAAAAWLVWVLAQESGANGVAAVLAAMVAFALAAFLWDTSKSAMRGWRVAASAVALIAFLLALSAVWAAGMTAMPASANASADVAGLPSEPYSAAKLASLRAQNRPVFVNATAAWCITCLVNDKVALSGSTVHDAFARQHVVYLVADWTNRNSEITALLSAHGRSGVPLYLYYAPGSQAPKVLPQVLTEGTVLSAIGSK